MRYKIEPMRYTSADIARLVPCSGYHVRKFADNGQLETTRDHNGWHIFNDPQGAIDTLRRLLCIEPFEIE